MKRAPIILAVLGLIGAASFLLAALCGSTGCMAGAGSDPMIWQLRFPRAASAFAVGGLLALAGALMQVLLRNPLADPYVLGISGGAATGAMALALAAPTLAGVSATLETLATLAFAPTPSGADGSALLAATGSSSMASLPSSSGLAAFLSGLPAPLLDTLIGLSNLLSDHAMPVGAMLGALLSVFLLFVLARRSLLRLSAGAGAAPAGVQLILTGVMIAAGFGALLTLMLSLAPDARLRGMIFWLMGDLDNSVLHGPAWIALGACLFWSMLAAPRLNVLIHGDAAAELLGVRVVRLRLGALLVASVATAAAVSVAGTVGFIGLVVPHALRLVIGNDQRLLLPAAALAGGATLSLADLAARTLAAPLQLPVGVITALVGVPVFLALLLRRGR